jgi:SAM-dependent methyltransferase
MNPATVNKIIDLNHQFYQTFAVQFARTRQRLQPGVRRIIESRGLYSPAARLLDLGCGNGELAHTLAGRGHQGEYVGLDFSAEMLAEARRREAEWRMESPSTYFACAFLQADLSDPGWTSVLPAGQDLPPAYELILAFAVLHHLPGAALRGQVIQRLRGCLTAGGRFIHSSWQFLNSPRLRRRIQPWESAGLSPAEVDRGDYLLDWKEGGYGLRYAHHLSEQELHSLAEENGFAVEESFSSDGESQDLGLYQIWKAA